MTVFMDNFNFFQIVQAFMTEMIEIHSVLEIETEKLEL